MCLGFVTQTVVAGASSHTLCHLRTITSFSRYWHCDHSLGLRTNEFHWHHPQAYAQDTPTQTYLAPKGGKTPRKTWILFLLHFMLVLTQFHSELQRNKVTSIYCSITKGSCRMMESNGPIVAPLTKVRPVRWHGF